MKDKSEIERLLGVCTVKGVTLTNLGRYRYAKMQFCMSSSEKRKIGRHLSNCAACRGEVEKMLNADGMPNPI